MLTDTTIEEFIEFCGHDGSGRWEQSCHPDKRRGFCMGEASAYFSLHRLHFGCFLTADLKVDSEVFSERHPALLTVKSQTLPPPTRHSVAWDGCRVFDPQKDESQDRDGYEIEEWWVLCEWSGRRNPLWYRRKPK